MEINSQETLRDFNRRNEKTKQFLIIGIFAVSIFSIITLIVFFNQRNHTLPTPILKKQQTFSPITDPELDTKTCALTKNRTPLLLNIFPSSTIITGTFIGIIDDFTSNTITIHSLDKKQTNTFFITKDIGIYSKTAQETRLWKDLASGKTVTLQFNCIPKKNNTFKLTDIGIVE